MGPSEDERLLRRAIALAHEARQHGEEPFGAVLVNGGAIVYEGFSRTVASNDPTRHAELGVISEYCQAHQQRSLEGFTLYSSTEPCPMCGGAIHWSRISRVVFSVTQAMLQERTGGRTKPAAVDLIHIGRQQVEVIGPLLADEGVHVFDGFRFQSPD
ncbi:MAG TPA: nucleoside deaminase [Aggregatilineales bacterium]|nr:nucleoside deaminase [Aggregatilineales bacterium]